MPDRPDNDFGSVRNNLHTNYSHARSIRAIRGEGPTFAPDGGFRSMVIQRSQIVLIGGMLLALFAGMVLGLTTGLLEGPRGAHAQPSPGHAFFQLCKQWESSGDQYPPRTFSFSVSDTEQAPVPVDIENVTEGGPPVCVTISALAG